MPTSWDVQHDHHYNCFKYSISMMYKMIMLTLHSFSHFAHYLISYYMHQCALFRLPMSQHETSYISYGTVCHDMSQLPWLPHCKVSK